MAGTDKQKQSLYFPKDMLAEIMREAIRLDRSLSWMVQQAWRIARQEVGKLPSIDHVVAAPETGRAPRAASVPQETRNVPESPGATDHASEREPSAQVLEFLRGKFERV
jgi:uncharacterized small protein (TIGR04563 family)